MMPNYMLIGILFIICLYIILFIGLGIQSYKNDMEMIIYEDI